MRLRSPSWPAGASRVAETTAARARALRAKHPDMPAAEIARRLKTSRQAVHLALAVTPGEKPVGRPRTDSAVLLRDGDRIRDAA